MEAVEEKEVEARVGTQQPGQEVGSQAPPIEKPAGAKRSSRALIAAAMAMALAVGAVAAFVASKYLLSSGPAETIRAAESPQSAEAPSAMDANVVNIDETQLQSIKLVPVALRGFRAEKVATGRIAFNEDGMTPVFSPFTGRVLRLLAKPGDVVRQGSQLLELYTPDLVQAESDLIGASSALAKARTALSLARRTEDRQHRLYLNKAAALKDWEQAESDLKNAESDVRAAEASIIAARDRLRVFGKTDTDIAKIEQEHKLDRNTTVLAPLAGTITARKVGPGQFIRPDNADPLFMVADLSKMWMLANVYESDVPLMQVGHPVEVHVMAYPHEVFKASISYIGASVDPNTHRVEVRAVVDNREQKLKPEMFATFRIITNADIQSPAVPLGAIIRDGEKASVWVAQQANRFARREVTLGIEQDGYAEIRSGLQPGERVVAEGSLLLSNVGRSS